MQGGCTNPNRKNRLGGDLLDDEDSREQVTLEDALHLLAKLGKPGTLVSDGRRTKLPMGSCLLHTSIMMYVFLIKMLTISRQPMRRPLSLRRIHRRFVEAGTGVPLKSESPSRVPSPLVAEDRGRAVPRPVGLAPVHMAVRDRQGRWSGSKDPRPAPGFSRAGGQLRRGPAASQGPIGGVPTCPSPSRWQRPGPVSSGRNSTGLETRTPGPEGRPPPPPHSPVPSWLPVLEPADEMRPPLPPVGV